ncbi:MAG: hypothetical protein ABEJ03_05240 [Candidatus Nanohaloarchaea archaeon]
MPIGDFNGNAYQIVYRPDYKLEDVENAQDWCITLVCKNPETEENEEVVTVDTAHGYVHIDLKFEYHPFKDDKIPLEHLDYWGAYNKVVENWEQFARKHEKHQDRM